MNTIGDWLRETRQAKNLSLEQVEANTRIRVRYLAAIEAGDFAAMPGGETQVRGFLRTYARFLGQAPDEALGRYDSEVHGISRPRVSDPGPPPPAPPPTTEFRPHNIDIHTSAWPRWLSPGVLIVVCVVLALIALSAWVGSLLIEGNQDGGRGTPVAAAFTPTPTIPAPADPVSTHVDYMGGVQLRLQPDEHVWVRVSTDWAVAFEGFLPVGQERTWTAQEVIILETGNAAALEPTVNGQAGGALGERGEVVRIAWGPNGQLELQPAAAP